MRFLLLALFVLGASAQEQPGVELGEDYYDLETTAEPQREPARVEDEGGCPPCDEEECVSPSNCPAGVAPDNCGCCQVCARSEGQLCDESPNTLKFGLCGENLACRKRSDASGEAVCTCDVNKMVCGDDGKTYKTMASEIRQPMAEYSPKSRTGCSGLVVSEMRPMAVVQYPHLLAAVRHNIALRD